MWQFFLVESLSETKATVSTLQCVSKRLFLSWVIQHPDAGGELHQSKETLFERHSIFMTTEANKGVYVVA